MKALTREQLASRKEKAVRFVRDVLEDPDRAAEIEDESLEDYAERRRIQVVNPHGGAMPTVRLYNPRNPHNPRNPRNPREQTERPSRLELVHRIRELEQENDDLQDRLDKVADLAEAPEDETDQTVNELKDALNEILDVAAPGEIEDGYEPGEE
jgi:hypothetical protein